MTVAERSHLARAAALAILAVILGGLWLGPVSAYCDWVGDGARALAADQQKLERYRALAHDDSRPAAPNDRAILLPAMSDAEGAALLQETLKAAAVGANVAIEGLQVLPPDKLAGAARIGVRVRARGDVAGLDRLLYAIEASRPLLHPDNLQIQSRAQVAAPAALDFQLDVSAFKGGPPA
jgi:general secretion pathway protein M